MSSLTAGAGETAQTITDQADKLTITVPQWLKLKAAIDLAAFRAKNSSRRPAR